MGNWRRVQMMGECPEEQLPALRDAVRCDQEWHDSCGPLTLHESLCGIGHWPSNSISVVGNLAERDYSVEQVADQLRSIVRACPGLDLRVHCGGDYESDECVATIVVKDGAVTVKDSEVISIPKLDTEKMLLRLAEMLRR